MNALPRLLLAALCVAVVSAAELPQPVPRPVAELLDRIAAAEPAEVIAQVDSWSGAAHPLLLLVRGQARVRLDRHAEAEADFRAALELDPRLRQARLGLAQCAVAREDWTAASREAAAGIDPIEADAAQLGFLAGVALRAGDWRLATLAAQQGILRFPDDVALRRTELAVLAHAGRAEDARQAALALLARAPQDAGLWRQLAWAAQETGRDAEALAALEAASAAAPADLGLRQRLAAQQLAHGLPQAALVTVRPLMAEPATVDDALLLLASRAAAEGGDLPQARAWLAATPEQRRSRAQRIQAARLAVQAGDQRDAAAALDALIAAGEREATVLAWAASLAEADGDDARAEALYLRAAELPAAALRMVAMYLRQDRRDEAATHLATYLAAHPDDAQARALQERLGGR